MVAARRFWLLLLLASALPAGEFPSVWFQGRLLDYEIVDGWAIHGGDMILGRAEELGTSAAGKSPPTKELTRVLSDGLWPEGVIPYRISPDVPNTQRIFDAMAHWEARTPIRFVAHSDQTDFVEIIRFEGGCRSALGRFGGVQNVLLDDLCSIRVTIHELGHTIGLFHEQQRADRDSYIRADFDSIRPDRAGAFRTIETSRAQPDYPYDYRSIMHYDAWGSANGIRPTMETVPPGIPYGPLEAATSEADAQGVMRLYGAPPADHVITTNPPGLMVEVDGVTMTAPARFDWEEGSEHTISVPTSQTLSNLRYSFARWSDEGARSHSITASEDRTIYIVNFIEQIRPQFGAEPADLGSVRVEPPGEDGFHLLRSIVALVAEPSDGGHFVRWSGSTDRDVHGDSANPVMVNVSRTDMEYRAEFAPRPPTRIEASFAGPSLLVDGRRAWTPTAFDWAEGEVHRLQIDGTLQFKRRSSSRFSISGWADGGLRNREVVAEAPGATFGIDVRLKHPVRVSPFPAEGGSVLFSPLPEQGRFYEEGAVVTITAVANEGFEWSRWGSDLIDESNPVQVVVGPNFSGSAGFVPSGRLPVNEPKNVTLPSRAVSNFDHFSFEVPPGAERLDVEISESSFSAFLNAYLRRDAPPRGTGTGILADVRDFSTAADRTLTVTTSSLPPLRAGVYHLALFHSPIGTPLDVRITANVTGGGVPPQLETESPGLTFVTGPRGAPAAQSFEVRNSGGGEASFVTATDVDWLAVDPADAAATAGSAAVITARVTNTAFPAGTYAGTVLVQEIDPPRSGKLPVVSADFVQLRVPVVLVVNPGGPRPVFSRAGLTNAAGFTPGLAPGTLATLFGAELAGDTVGIRALPAPGEVAGVQVQVGGTPAPLLFVSPSQINFQIPFGTPTNTPVLVTVTRDLNPSEAVMASFSPHAIAIFEDPQTGNAIAVRVPGGELVSDQAPARPGEILAVFATGLGVLVDPPGSGRASPTDRLVPTASSVKATLGGVDVEVLFAGLAPEFVGLTQFNLRLPNELPSGPSMELIFAADGLASPEASIPVR